MRFDNKTSVLVLCLIGSGQATLIGGPGNHAGHTVATNNVIVAREAPHYTFNSSLLFKNDPPPRTSTTITSIEGSTTTTASSSAPTKATTTTTTPESSSESPSATAARTSSRTGSSSGHQISACLTFAFFGTLGAFIAGSL